MLKDNLSLCTGGVTKRLVWLQSGNKETQDVLSVKAFVETGIGKI